MTTPIAIHPAAVAHARRAVTDTDLAARLPEDLRTEAWHILLDNRRAMLTAGSPVPA
ncbi:MULTISPECIES: hypothetical protein [Haematobacter]|uniref:hypothetical protein n=1 Tax=Haematobacter TaxID=366614 RepID=UPI0012EB5711|nr:MULTISPECIES: hypothetical protein [Haematobacter]